MGYWPPQGSVYVWQYGNNVYPVQNDTNTLQPYLSYATINNSSNQYLLYLQNNWNTNGTVGNDVECFGSAVVNTSMTCLSQGYGYDNLNRLTSAGENYYQNPGSGAGYSRNFSYDEYGNMSVSASSNVPTSGLMPQTSQSPFNTANNQLKTATYADPRGNMTLVAAGSVSMSYDGESRQTKTVDPGTGVTMNYLYDGAGQRVQKQSSNGTTTVDVHDVFGQLVAEYSSVGVTPACTTCYLTYDGLGSVRLVTDQNAGIVTRHDYLPYGEEIPNGSAGRCCNNFGNTANVTQMFTGQERDGGTADLDYFNARHMSNILGRFTQPDPGGAGADVTNPQTWNAYAYVGGNPLAMTDPSGMVGLSTYYPPTDGLNCYSAERQDPCDGDVDGGGFFGKLPIHYGGGRPSGGAAGTATGATGTSGPAVGSPGTAPSSSGGETLGLPPGISVPLPGLASITGVGTGCEFGACGGGSSDFTGGDDIVTGYPLLLPTPWLLRFVGQFFTATGNALHAPPLKVNSGVCAIYGNKPYLGAGLQCVCQNAGDGQWSQDTRGCLAADQKDGINEYIGHGTCYAGSTTRTRSVPPATTLLKSYWACKTW